MGTDIWIVAEVRKNGIWTPTDVKVPSYRNYITFSILADVRNGFDVGGINSGEEVIPISPPKGLPNDFASDPDWIAEHNFSWLTLQELLSYPFKDTKVTLLRMVPTEEAKEYRESKKIPVNRCIFTTGEGYEWFKFESPLEDEAWLFPKIIEALKPLGKPEDVRIVFGFDS